MPQAAPTDDLFTRMAEKIQDTFAERDPVTGELDEEAVVIKWPDGQESKCKAILSSLEVENVGGLNGTLRAMAFRFADIKPEHWKVKDFPAETEFHIGDETWRLSSDGHKRSAVFLRLKIEDPQPRSEDGRQPE